MENDSGNELLVVWDEARGHIERGEYDKAIEIYKYVLLRYADDPVASEYASAYVGDVLLTTRRLELAERYLKKAIGYAPQKPHYHYLLGFTHSVMRRFWPAIREFKVALGLEPNNAEYERGLGWAVFESGERQDGLAHLYRAQKLLPTDVNILTDLAAAMLIMGNINKAREYGKKAIAIDPENTLVRGLLENADRINRLKKKQA